MNVDIIKNEIEKKVGSKVKIKVNGLRNKTNTYIGVISDTYPYIFTANIDGDNKSFSYADVITGDVEITYL